MRQDNVVLGLGSNLGDRKRNLEKAKFLLKKKTEIVKESGFYECQPFGFHKQPWFINQCIRVATDLSPRDLLTFCKEIEAEIGREKGRRWGPRLIDIDILLYGDEKVNEEDLKIPHPQFTWRRFVLIPYVELDRERGLALLYESEDMSIVIPL